MYAYKLQLRKKIKFRKEEITYNEMREREREDEIIMNEKRFNL